VKIEIIDTGIGISAENIHRLFNPFIQTHSGQYQYYYIYIISLGNLEEQDLDYGFQSALLN
jgi:signal transduction histidine kinase